MSAHVKRKSTPKALTSPAVLAKLLPEVPQFIYDCISKTPEELETLQQDITALALLTNAKQEDLSSIIRTWSEDVSLVTQFEFRSPSESEWHALTRYFPQHPDIALLAEKYPENFSIHELSKYTVHLLAFVKDWHSWVQHNTFRHETYFHLIREFNSVEHHPDFGTYKAAFHGNHGALNTLLGQKAEPTNWLQFNPYAKSEEEQDAWLIKLGAYTLLPPSTLNSLYRKGKLPLALWHPGMFMFLDRTCYVTECLELIKTHESFKKTTVAYLLPELKSNASTHTVLRSSNACLALAKAMLKENLFSEEECLKLFTRVWLCEIMKVWQVAEQHYSDVLNQNWVQISELAFDHFVVEIPPERFLSLKPPSLTLLRYACQKQNAVVLKELKKVIHTIPFTSINSDQMLVILKKKWLAVPYAAVHTLCLEKDAWRYKSDLWKAWLDGLKTQMTPLDFQALTLYIIRQNPELRPLAVTYDNIAQRVLNIVS